MAGRLETRNGFLSLFPLLLSFLSGWFPAQSKTIFKAGGEEEQEKEEKPSFFLSYLFFQSRDTRCFYGGEGQRKN